MKQKQYTILGVITARGGSKGLPGKNVKPLGGRPLIAWTIECAKQSVLLTHCIVSTDDPKIAEAAKAAGADVPFVRPKELAQDTTPHIPVMQHAVSFMEKALGIHFDYVVILQPTSPFRTPEDLDGTIGKLINHRADSAVSLVEAEGGEHPMKMKKLEGEWVVPYCLPEVEGMRRQDFPKVYKRSGSVYCMRRGLIMDDKKLYGEKVIGYLVPKDRSIDIDTPLDWLKAEYMYTKLYGKKT